MPIFIPDATKGFVKRLDSADLKLAGIEGVVVNAYHLMTYPGVDVLKNACGIKKFMNFDGLVVSDSGGWQIFSLIHRTSNASLPSGSAGRKAGKITDDGVVFTTGGSSKQLFTPEKAIEVQFDIGADIIVCLDDFTPPNSSELVIKESVDRTILWAKRSKEKYLKLLEERGLGETTRPFLLGVIQGGYGRELRKYCAEKLIDIGFDGLGYGGWAIDEKSGKLDLEISDYIAKLIPDEYIKSSLGTGTPYDIVNLAKMGWDIFDCTLPTRDARHKRLYIFAEEPKSAKDLLNPEIHEFIYISREKFKHDLLPISEFCDCYTCKNYSRAYLYHLFRVGDPLAERLASIHNLRHFSRVIELIRRAS